MDNQYSVAITAIIVKDGKYLITRRSPTKRKFPGVWTVPGGTLESTDYINHPRDTENAWYNVFERVVMREVKEETGLDIGNLDYLISLVADYGEAHGVVVSLMADYRGGEVKLQTEETDDYAWVTLEEAKNYKLIDGIYDELVMAENKRKGLKAEWRNV